MRRGVTLVEMLIAAVITVMVFAAVFGLLTSGGKLYSRSLQVAAGRQASLLFFDQLEDDLAGCTVMPGHAGPPMAISKDRSALAFYRVDRTLSTLQVTVAKPVDWKLSGAARDAERWPVRNGVAWNHLRMSAITFTLMPPDRQKKLTAWLLGVHAVFPEGGLTGRAVPVWRVIELAQPSSLTRFGPSFVAELPPLSFVMLEAPRTVAPLLLEAGLRPGAGPAPVASKESTPATTPTTGEAI